MQGGGNWRGVKETKYGGGCEKMGGGGCQRWVKRTKCRGGGARKG